MPFVNIYKLFVSARHRIDREIIERFKGVKIRVEPDSPEISLAGSVRRRDTMINAEDLH